MTLTERYGRLPRKSVWLSPDEYNTLHTLKSQYEANSGETDWGKFLLLLAGVAIGVGLLKALSSAGSSHQTTIKVGRKSLRRGAV